MHRTWLRVLLRVQYISLLMPFVAKQNQMLETDVLRVNSSETNTSGHVPVSGVCPVADTWYLVVEEDGGGGYRQCCTTLDCPVG